MTEVSKLPSLDAEPPTKKLLVYGGTRNRSMDSYMTCRESAWNLQAVEDEVVQDFNKRLNECTDQLQYVQVLQEMVDKDINVVSADGYRVFSTAMMVEILNEHLKNKRGFYILNFNRTLNIRYKVAELFLDGQGT
jgi:hypothetical protein